MKPISTMILTDPKITDNVLLSSAWFLTGLSGFSFIPVALACLASISVIVKNVDEFITAHRKGETKGRISRILNKLKRKQNKKP